MSASGPRFSPLSSAAGTLRLAGVVPEDLAHLEGHFPGHPIVPGFMQVDWALVQAAERLGVAAGVRAFEALKFPNPLGPGAPIELELALDVDQLRFRLGGGGQVFSSGKMRLDPALAGHEAVAEPHTLAAAAPLRIPHAGSMQLLECVVRHDAASTTSIARLSAGGPLCEADTGGSTCLAIELLGQGMAAHGGLAGQQEPAPRRGFLVAARRIALRTCRFRCGEQLWVRADHVRGELGMVAFRCALGSGEIPEDEVEAQQRALAFGSLGAFIEPAT